ncbi:BTB domain-containing protein [Favolaschia claudopus]|uniref:BTB domain-containing protein n=1 Tax=Favolaschia claudopus TaxID=2862362 RepID=A0AAW0CFI3_9AGAR
MASQPRTSTVSSKSSKATLKPHFIPQSPFDDTDADAILTSSDGVDFRVYRVILSLLSPIFKDLFRLPQPPGSPQVPSIHMAENAVTLDRVLRFCYPGAELNPQPTLDQLRQILEICLLKYDMQSMIPTAKKYVTAFATTNPIAVFAIACCHEWKDIASVSARNSLQLPIRSFDSRTVIKELEFIPASHYDRLLRYHATCSAVCVAATQTLEWLDSTQQTWFTCRNPKCIPTQSFRCIADREVCYARNWFVSYMKEVRKTLKVRPAARVDDPALMVDALIGMVKCSTCRGDGFEELQWFATISLASRIATVLEKVKLDLPF